MTGEQYIYKRNSNYNVVKTVGSKAHTFGFFKSLDEAIFVRKLLMDCDWNLDEIKKLGDVWQYNGQFVVVSIFNNQIRFLEKFDSYQEASENSQRIIREFENNPHRSMYGTYIYKIKDAFYIRKLIGKNEVLFGLYKNIEDATFSRDLLKDNDWDLDKIKELAPVCFSEIHNKYVVFGINNDKLIVAGKFDTESEALKNAQKSLEEYEKSKYKTGEKHVVYNGKLFAVHRAVSGKITYYGSFKELEDAVAVRDLLVSVDWDISMVYENRIYEFNSYFYKFHIFEGIVKIIGKFTSHDDAMLNQNNLSDLTYEDIYDPENQYSKINRYITKRSGKFWIKKKIGGNVIILGPYKTRSDAIDARDEYEENGWDSTLDEESIYSARKDYDDYLDEIVSGMSMWQKIMYDTIVRLDKTYFTFDELLNHSYLKRYKSGNFEEKVKKHLDELVDLGLVSQLEVNIFKKEF